MNLYLSKCSPHQPDFIYSPKSQQTSNSLARVRRSRQHTMNQLKDLINTPSHNLSNVSSAERDSPFRVYAGFNTTTQSHPVIHAEETSIMKQKFKTNMSIHAKKSMVMHHRDRRMLSSSNIIANEYEKSDQEIRLMIKDDDQRISHSSS